MFVIRMRTILIYLFILAVMFCTIHFFVTRETTLPVDGEGEAAVELPILMYHGVTESPKQVSKFVISSRMLEEDLKYLAENGYETVTMAEVIAYVKEGDDLPEKPVMLTFDDGYYNNYCYAFPLLRVYNAKAVISIIGKYTDLYTDVPDENPAYSHVTWNEVQEMMDSGLVEFQNHSYDLHTNTGDRNGTKKKWGESDAEYAQCLKEDIGLLQQEMQEHTGYTPTTFTYPFGSVSEASYAILRDMGFQASLSCEEKNNYITRNNPACLEMLNRCLRSDKASAKEILEKLKVES